MIGKRLLMVGLLGGLLASVSPALRADDIRPIATEDIAVLPLKQVQLEVGESYIDEFRSIRTGEVGSLWEDGHIAVRWGVGTNVEVWVEGTPYKQFTVDATNRHNQGVGDFSLWGKFRFWQSQDSSAAFGFRFGVKLPNSPSDKDFGTNLSDVYTLLMARKSWGRFELWGEVGLGILDNPYKRQSNDDVYPYGLASSFQLGERWLVAAEMTGLRSRGKPVLYGNNSQGRLAFVFSPKARWAFDLSGAWATGSGKVYGRWSVTGGLSYRFGS